jgi:ribosomal protein S21
VNALRSHLVSDDVREGLRVLKGSLAARVEQRREQSRFYSVASSKRPTNAVVQMELGRGADPGALAQALKVLRKRMDDGGTWGAIKLRAEGYQKPGDRKRAKSIRARRRRSKQAKKMAQQDRWE